LDSYGYEVSRRAANAGAAKHLVSIEIQEVLEDSGKSTTGFDFAGVLLRSAARRCNLRSAVAETTD